MNYNVYASGPRKGQCKLLRDRLIRYLEESERMICVRKSDARTVMRFAMIEKFIFIGKNGGARIGKNITHSINCADKLMAKMKAWETEKGLMQEES